MRAKTFEFIKILNRARPQFYCLNPVIQTGTSIMTTTTSMKSISSNSFVTENSITNGENGIDDHNHSNGIDDNKNNSNGSNNASMQTDRKSIMSTMKDTGSMSQQHQHLSTPSVQQTSSSSSSYTTTLPQSSDFMLNNGYI
ncbi:Actin- protein 2/3 complex subunit 2 [Schistosoma haematobium]|nr:Actin- protein 2/3 complex subunit 2 [Schistosoma haematobium]KAH9579267.1 Actin- protein 2/3 complex subunit 2 [Schistosoma haematobium]